MDVIKIAKIAHKAHNVIKESQGHSITKWSNKSIEHRKLVVESVLGILNGTIENSWDAHNQFVSKKIKNGWSWGEEYCLETKVSPRLINYSQLSDEDRLLDEVFFSIVSSFKLGLYGDKSL